MFEGASAFDGLDLVRDYGTGSDDDILDISDVLDTFGYDSGSHTLSDWVHVTVNGAHNYIAVDRDGTGGTYSMTNLFYLENYNSLDANASNLVSSGTLVV